MKDKDRLIKQAVYLKDREKENKALKKHMNSQTQTIEDLKQQNKRYREAIEEVTQQYENEIEIDDDKFMWNVNQILSKALKGDPE